ncbi:DUF397 domain-containing protein [Streptomyces chartreusis]
MTSKNTPCCGKGVSRMMYKRHRRLTRGVDVEFQSIARWEKSSHSGNSETCLEICRDAAILVRDSKSPGRGPLTYEPGAWVAFIRAVHHHPSYAKACVTSNANECSSFQKESK